MITTSLSKAKRALLFLDRKEVVTITYKEVINDELRTSKRNFKAWEAANLLDIINKIAFIRMKY